MRDAAYLALLAVSIVPTWAYPHLGLGVSRPDSEASWAWIQLTHTQIQWNRCNDAGWCYPSSATGTDSAGNSRCTLDDCKTAATATYGQRVTAIIYLGLEIGSLSGGGTSGGGNCMYVGNNIDVQNYLSPTTKASNTIGFCQSFGDSFTAWGTTIDPSMIWYVVNPAWNQDPAQSCSPAAPPSPLPPPLPPLPPPPPMQFLGGPAAVQFSVPGAGTVSDYTPAVVATMEANIAQQVSVNSASVVVTVTAASSTRRQLSGSTSGVTISGKIWVPSGTAALAAEQSLTISMAAAVSASSILGITATSGVSVTLTQDSSVLSSFPASARQHTWQASSTITAANGRIALNCMVAAEINDGQAALASTTGCAISILW